MFLKYLKIPNSATRYLDEIVFVPLFISVITVNKYVLSELRFAVPTVFQGWQTFTCVLLLSLLIKFEKIKNDLQILDRRTVYLLLPVLFGFAISIVAGSKALAELPVPVFLAITNLTPAVLAILDKKNSENTSSLKVCGSITICGTVITIIVMNLTRWNLRSYLWLLGHVSMNLMQIMYFEKVGLELTNVTKIYYRNFFSVVLLMPISVYLDVLHLPVYVDWRFYYFYVGCLLSGILGTFLQLWICRIETKSSSIDYQSFAKLLASVLAYEMFFANIEPAVWLLIVINLTVGIFVLNMNEKVTDNSEKQNTVVVTSPVIDINIDTVKRKDCY